MCMFVFSFVAVVFLCIDSWKHCGNLQKTKNDDCFPYLSSFTRIGTMGCPFLQPEIKLSEALGLFLPFMHAACVKFEEIIQCKTKQTRPSLELFQNFYIHLGIQFVCDKQQGFHAFRIAFSST